MENNPIPPNPPRWAPNLDPSTIQVPGLDTTAPILDQIEQMEQLITIKLQNIDENFSKIHSVLANRILPAVKRYAVATKPVREAANFWVSFYEQAAQIRIPTYDDYSTVNEVPSEREELTSETESSSRTEESTVRHEDHSVTSTESSFMPGQAAFASTPATGRVMNSFQSHDDPSWSASLESPLTRLDREVQNFSREDSAASSKLPSLPSLRLDSVPEEERTVIRPRPDKGKGKEAEPLLQNVLRQTLHSTTGSDISFSPRKGKLKTQVPNGLNPYLPRNIEPANWSGLVDLRQTPLSTPGRKKNPDPGADSDDDSFDGLPPGMSPPVLMSPARPPRSTAELQLLWGKTPAKEAAARIKNDLVRDVQRQNFAKATRGYGGESSMSTVSTPPSLSRYNRTDTDESAVDTSLESVMQRVALNPPSWTPSTSTPGLRIRKAVPNPNYMPPPPLQYQPPPMTSQQYDDGGAYDSDSSDEEVNNTAHPSAAFLMAAQGASGSGGSFDEDDSFQSQDSLDRADADLAALQLEGGVVDVHPFARGGYAAAYTGDGDDSFDDETFDAGVPEETVFGRPPAQRAGQARLSEAGDLLMYGDEGSAAPDTMQYGVVGSSPTPHYRG